jgi:flagellar basal body-associated protein FliL
MDEVRRDEGRPEPEIFRRPVIDELPPDKKKKAIKLLMLGLGLLILVLVAMLLVSYVRFSNLKAECQYKLDYWVEKCADRVPSNMPNITIDITPTPVEEEPQDAIIEIPMA